MDPEMKFCRSLPPLVEGKIHGYLKLVIDEVILSKRRSPGDIRIFASWWGESDSAQFRQADITKNVPRSEHDTTEIYAIRTNISLFEDYVRNCETVELVIVDEQSNTIIGTSQITDLLDIFELKPCFKYCPMFNDSGNRIGEIHVSIKLLHTTKLSNMQFKTSKQERKQIDDNTIVSAINILKNQKDVTNDRSDIYRKPFNKESDVYKSILKLKRTEFQEPQKRFNNEVTDKLVAQVVARAQRLRGAILKETYNEDPLALSDSSLSDGLPPVVSTRDEANLYEYFLGKEMSSYDEHRALNTLRLTSPTPSLIELPSESIEHYRYDNKRIMSNSMSYAKINSFLQEIPPEEELYKNLKETLVVNHVDRIRIFVESFTLSPAGYRRVKSSSLSRNNGTPLSVTYFVQYDTSFGNVNSTGKYIIENKPIRICSKKQIDQVIYFNHNGVYDVPKSQLRIDYLIKFKIFVRHLNQKSPTELGIGSMCVNDIIKTENWNITQRLAIVNKGIKIGEICVTVELGSDLTQLGKQHDDDVMSTKENVPILKMRSILNADESKRNKCMTGTHCKVNSQVSSASIRGVDTLVTDNNIDLTQHKTESVDDGTVDFKNQENSGKDKVLLHGLIYIAEGKDLPELNTYLICRAFWREDKSTSQICNNTKNPFYNFGQLVPLIHGTDLLDRIKDNYIIIEVYCRSNDRDNLLGLAKLSVHQLYVAYRDPLVLPHLLLSKYPIISVDGLVPITNPVTGESCGQLLALVALGTIEQIALLEVSRGLRNPSTIPQTVPSYPQRYPNCTKYLQCSQESMEPHTPGLQRNVETVQQVNNFTFRTTDVAENESHCSNFKTQESQTDISTVKGLKLGKSLQEVTFNSEHLVLHSLVDRLAQVLTARKESSNQAAQTEIESEQRKQTGFDEQMCLNELNLNNISDDSDSSSVRNNLHLPMEMYRSVGVGAEYDEELDQQANAGYNNAHFALPPTIQHTEDEEIASQDTRATFRTIIEIECALHLPKVEKTNETIEPSTYVSFQAEKSDCTNQLNSYTITNVFPRSCNPKWNWKCETKLPIELLLNNEKRLILKIWRILDTDTITEVNLDRDIVIGFAAIDLSVLVTGFPTVSGWFHIIDFTGKCNGQIKVCITPLDNLSTYGKSSSTLSTMRGPVHNLSELSWSPMYQGHREMRYVGVEQNNVKSSLSTTTYEEVKPINTENQLNEPVAQVNHGFEDVSMSFLSLSLKQKLTELDEITKRLESRLRDVTNTAFEEDFENEFDPNEPNSDSENIEQRNIDAAMSGTATHSRICQAPQLEKKLPRDKERMENGSQIALNKNEACDYVPETYSRRGRTLNYEVDNISTSKTFTFPSVQNLSNDNYESPQHAASSMQNNNTLENNADYPVRGTKVHINHLLDKLSLQLPVRSFTTKNTPVRTNIIDLLTNLQQNNNNIPDNNNTNQEPKMCTEPTQTDDTEEQNVQNFQNQITSNTVAGANDSCNYRNVSEKSTNSQSSNKISTVIREELVAEENSDTSNCDELTTYLITSNVRHTDLDSIFNPLFYQHLVSDSHLSNTVSPEGQAIEQLDNRYARAFNASIDNRLNKAQNVVEVGASSTNGSCMQDRYPGTILQPPENAELFRMTPSGVSENIDGNIDLTVVHKSSYDDLMASNSTESTTTILPEKSSLNNVNVDMTDTSYSTSSEISVPALSRQAPDGGNPIEDIAKPLTVQRQDDSQGSSLSS